MKEIIYCILVSLSVSSCQNNNIEAEIRNAMLECVEESIAPGMGLGYYSEKAGTIMLAVGQSDIENDTPLSISTHYPIQSTTKMFMSVLIIQLIEDGKLTLESTIDEWVDYVPNSSKITIRHLLTHTSGLNNYLNNSEFTEAYFSGTGKEYTRDDLIHAGIEVSHDREIGNWEYSNTNYLLLAKIIETITHQSLGQALEQFLFRAAEMDNTYFKPEVVNDSTNIVKCYRFGELVDLDKWNYLANAGGGIVSTIDDMLNFGQWILENKYPLQMAAESEVIHLFDSEDDSGKYGLGIEVVDSLYCIPMMGHSGGNPGLIHFFYFSIETREIIIYYVNEGRVGNPFGKFMKDIDRIMQKYR